MYQPEYEYRVLVNDVAVHFTAQRRPTRRNWVRDINTAIARAHELREVNERAIVTIEVSPWAYFNTDMGEKWECPGCEYAECPSNERAANRWLDNHNLDKIRS